MKSTATSSVTVVEGRRRVLGEPDPVGQPGQRIVFGVVTQPVLALLERLHQPEDPNEDQEEQQRRGDDGHDAVLLGAPARSIIGTPRVATKMMIES